MIYKPTKEEEESDRIGCGCICSVLVATIIPGIILIVQEGLVLKDIYITRINGKCINQPIGLINGSIPETYHNLNKREAITEESRTIKVTLEQAREWYNSDNLALRTLALSTFKESELNIDLEYIMTAIIGRRKIFPPTAKEVAKQQTLAHLKFIAEYFNKTWEKLQKMLDIL